jgi:hypothetical protein
MTKKHAVTTKPSKTQLTPKDLRALARALSEPTSFMNDFRNSGGNIENMTPENQKGFLSLINVTQTEEAKNHAKK